MKGSAFVEFVRVKLVPKSKAEDVVVLAKLHAHHREEIRAIIESVGARVASLPVYSPAFNPIEMMWSQVKSLVCKLSTKTIEALGKVIKLAVSLIHPEFLKNWLTKCCYCT